MAVGWVLHQLGPRFRSNNAGDGPEKTRDRKFWFPRFKSTLLGSYRSKATYVLCECALATLSPSPQASSSPPCGTPPPTQAHPGATSVYRTKTTNGHHCACGRDEWHLAKKVEEQEYAVRLEVSKQYGGMRYDDALAQHAADVERCLAHYIPQLPCKLIAGGCHLCDAGTSSQRLRSPCSPLAAPQGIVTPGPSIASTYMVKSECYDDDEMAPLPLHMDQRPAHWKDPTLVHEYLGCFLDMDAVKPECSEPTTFPDSNRSYPPPGQDVDGHPFHISHNCKVEPPWATHPCAQIHCANDYNRCVKLFYGDGCSCYPGLLGCAINACTNNNDEYASVLDMCYDSLQVDGRCALQCYPGYFPVDIAAVVPSEINATSHSSSNHSFVDNGDDETIREPVSVTWTVLATWSLTNTTAIDLKNSSSAFVDTLVEFLQTSYTSTLSAANVTLHLVSKSPTLQEVSAVVHVESLAALNATDRALESLLLDTINSSDDRGDGNDFGGKLVEADVIRHTTQFNTRSVKIQVIATGTNGNSSNYINATTPPALHKPTNNNANDQTILGLTPGMLLVLAAAGTALLALIIVCLSGRNHTRRRFYVTPFSEYWSPCLEKHCRPAYRQCLDFFGGDGCLCYPGLLGCASPGCGVESVASVYESCAASFNRTDTRCALSCEPSPYPTVHEPTPDDIDSRPRMSYTVMMTLEIEAINQNEIAGAAFEMADAVAQIINMTDVTLDHVTLSTITATADDLSQVYVIVSCPSPEAMNATLNALEAMVGVTGSTHLGAALVDFNVLFDATQLQVLSVYEAVEVQTQSPPPVFTPPSSAMVPPPSPPPTQPSSQLGTLVVYDLMDKDPLLAVLLCSTPA
ncbi:hypothetical protein DYB35_007514 [Aphanomyces astaci]|uniref:Uncharacterized protein n=1 Tax=Aphanomyces astaci TaxID=112090 RepID=A0A3R6X0F7_APHAT|nr:hypothetical protein DYB35_007514 [Aphanomyces astaci]